MRIRDRSSDQEIYTEHYRLVDPDDFERLKLKRDKIRIIIHKSIIGEGEKILPVKSAFLIPIRFPFAFWLSEDLVETELKREEINQRIRQLNTIKRVKMVKSIISRKLIFAERLISHRKYIQHSISWSLKTIDLITGQTLNSGEYETYIEQNLKSGSLNAFSEFDDSCQMKKILSFSPDCNLIELTVRYGEINKRIRSVVYSLSHQQKSYKSSSMFYFCMKIKSSLTISFYLAPHPVIERHPHNNFEVNSLTHKPSSNFELLKVIFKVEKLESQIPYEHLHSGTNPSEVFQMRESTFQNQITHINEDDNIRLNILKVGGNETESQNSLKNEPFIALVHDDWGHCVLTRNKFARLNEKLNEEEILDTEQVEPLGIQNPKLIRLHLNRSRPVCFAPNYYSIYPDQKVFFSSHKDIISNNKEVDSINRRSQRSYQLTSKEIKEMHASNELHSKHSMRSSHPTEPVFPIRELGPLIEHTGRPRANQISSNAMKDLRHPKHDTLYQQLSFQERLGVGFKKNVEDNNPQFKKQILSYKK